MMQRQNSIKYTVAAGIWALVVLFHLLGPSKMVDVPQGLSVPGLDKIAHFILFAVQTFLIIKMVRERAWSFKAWSILSALTLFAIGTELAQLLTPDRTGDVLDVCADFAGIAVVLIFYKSL